MRLHTAAHGVLALVLMAGAAGVTAGGAPSVMEPAQGDATRVAVPGSAAGPPAFHINVDNRAALPAPAPATRPVCCRTTSPPPPPPERPAAPPPLQLTWVQHLQANGSPGVDAAPTRADRCGKGPGCEANTLDASLLRVVLYAVLAAAALFAISAGVLAVAGPRGFRAGVRFGSKAADDDGQPIEPSLIAAGVCVAACLSSLALASYLATQAPAAAKSSSQPPGGQGTP